MNSTFLSSETARYYEDMWISRQLKEMSNGKYCFLNDSQFGKFKKEWWSIISDEEWGKINFHFELRWSSYTSMTEASKLNIRIHLESQYCGEEFDRKARGYFEAHGCILKDNTIKEVNNEKINGAVIPDFSSEESAKNTIAEIIAILDSSAYQQCAGIANDFISELKKAD